MEQRRPYVSGQRMAQNRKFLCRLYRYVGTLNIFRETNCAVYIDIDCFKFPLADLCRYIKLSSIRTIFCAGTFASRKTFLVTTCAVNWCKLSSLCCICVFLFICVVGPYINSVPIHRHMNFFLLECQGST